MDIVVVVIGKTLCLSRISLTHVQALTNVMKHYDICAVCLVGVVICLHKYYFGEICKKNDREIIKTCFCVHKSKRSIKRNYHLCQKSTTVTLCYVRPEWSKNNIIFRRLRAASHAAGTRPDDASTRHHRDVLTRDEE